MTRRSIPLLATTAVLLIVGPVRAQESDCSVELNGIEIERVDTLDSPLELETVDTLIATGSDPGGTLRAVVRLFIGPIPVESGTTTYATPEQSFSVAIALDDVSPYGVGLFHAAVVTDGCETGGWVRVSGRFPLATLTGLTAVGLTVGGLTGQLGAVASRRRWARSAAAVGGIATGTGVALVGQQFGRLQLSYISVGGLVAAAALVGFMLAAWLNPGLREQRRNERAAAADRRTIPPTRPATSKRPETRTTPMPPTGAEPSIPSSTPGRSEADPAAEEEEPAGTPRLAAEPTHETRDSNDTPSGAQAAGVAPGRQEQLQRPSPGPAGPYWCYVLAPTAVLDLSDHTRTVATLDPGTWYLAKRTSSGWVHVVAGEGLEGWVPEAAVNRP